MIKKIGGYTSHVHGKPVVCDLKLVSIKKLLLATNAGQTVDCPECSQTCLKTDTKCSHCGEEVSGEEN